MWKKLVGGEMMVIVEKGRVRMELVLQRGGGRMGSGVTEVEGRSGDRDGGRDKGA